MKLVFFAYVCHFLSSWMMLTKREQCSRQKPKLISPTKNSFLSSSDLANNERWTEQLEWQTTNVVWLSNHSTKGELAEEFVDKGVLRFPRKERSLHCVKLTWYCFRFFEKGFIWEIRWLQKWLCNHHHKNVVSSRR